MSTLRVDKISPFQSSSVEIDGAITIPGVATTGSNTFTGDQNIQGALTASLEEGYAWVGGAGNVSVAVATSSFGGGGSTDISALNSFTASQEELNTTFATTGSNTFDGNQTLTAGAVQVSSGSLGANRVSGLSSTGLSITDPTGGMGQTKNIALAANPSVLGGPLASWTQPTLYGLGSAGPYQIAEFQSQGNFTDGTATFKVPLIVSGNVEQTIPAPGSESQTDFITVSGSEISGKTYDYTNFGIINYGASFGGEYANAFAFESYDSLAYNFGSELKLNGKGFEAIVLVSGSSGGAKLSLIDKYDGTTESKLQADTVLVGKISGSTNVTGNFVIETIDTLPAGTPGQIAFQSGNMYVFISGQWNQVAFVPPPQTEYTLTGPEMTSGSACSSVTTATFHTNGSAPNPSVFLYQDSELTLPANDGYYASLEASQWFEVSGSAGEITATGPCE